MNKNLLVAAIAGLLAAPAVGGRVDHYQPPSPRSEPPRSSRGWSGIVKTARAKDRRRAAYKAQRAANRDRRRRGA